ncbi:MAG TPA: hypothetical protein VD969_06035 [Symbiobacteriaceae bacterium]|nr:hypothetical protein [Symbiobacteriaceae bacterium]
MPERRKPGGSPIEGDGGPGEGRPIAGDGGGPAGGRPIGDGIAGAPGGLPIRSEAGPPAPGRPVEPEPEFGLPGASIEAPGAYFAGGPVLGPGSIFNIAGAPIAILGGVFGNGLPIGGPISQIFRSGAPLPNTLYIAELESSGPIGAIFLPTGGGPIGPMGRPGTEGLPISMAFGEGGVPVFALVPVTGGLTGTGFPIGEPSRGGLQL